MRFGEYQVEVRGDAVEISRRGEVSKGRWSSGRIVDRHGDPSTPWNEIELALRREAEALVAETNAAAYDARGVDVTQIDRMLAMSPLERLEVMDEQRQSVLRLTGHAPRD